MPIVRSFADFESSVDSTNDGRIRLYRGQANAQWRLESSYARLCRQHGRDADPGRWAILFREFVRRASGTARKDIAALPILEQVAFARHLGLSTPLLDWSESPYIAAFFAVSERVQAPSTDAYSIWELRVPDGVSNESPPGSIEELVKEPLRIWRGVSFDTRRIERQMGWFSFYAGCDFEEAVRKDSSKVVQLVRYNLDGEKWLSVIRRLQMMGITSATLFDSADHIALDVIARDLLRRA